MPKGTVTTKIKTACPFTDSEMLKALQNSMGPIFAHFEQVIGESGGSAVLEIEVTAREGDLKLNYGFRPANVDVEASPPLTPQD